MNNQLIRGGYSEFINLLRFPLAVLVVFIHALGSQIDVEQLHASGLTGMSVYDYLRIFINAVIARSAVPLFFIFSGFLLFKGVEEYGKKVYVGKLRKRWHSLARPYLVWNVLIVLWTLAFKVGGILLHGKPWSGIGDYFIDYGCLHMLWDSSVWYERTTWLGNTVESNGPVLLPFWYMRDLIVMVILSPVVYWLVKRLRIVFILLLLAVYLADIRPSYYSATIATAALFFSIGAYFSIMKHDFTQVLWRWRYVILPLAVALIIVQTSTGSDFGNSTSRLVHLWLVVVQTLAFLIVGSYLCRYRRLYEWCKRLAPASFFIYASHVFILYHVVAAINKVMPMGDTWYVKIICFLAAPIVCVAICTVTYRCMIRWMPGVMRVLTGKITLTPKTL